MDIKKELTQTRAMLHIALGNCDVLLNDYAVSSAQLDCIDDSESVVGIPKPTGQVFLSRVVANAPLSVKEFGETQQQVSKAA